MSQAHSNSAAERLIIVALRVMTVIAAVIAWLMIRRAGHVCGLDGAAARMAGVRRSPALRWLVGLSTER